MLRLKKKKKNFYDPLDLPTFCEKNADELILSVVMHNKCNLLIMYCPVNLYE